MILTTAAKLCKEARQLDWTFVVQMEANYSISISIAESRSSRFCLLARSIWIIRDSKLHP
jgi:hypothetical protein